MNSFEKEDFEKEDRRLRAIEEEFRVSQISPELFTKAAKEIEEIRTFYRERYYAAKDPSRFVISVMYACFIDNVEALKNGEKDVKDVKGSVNAQRIVWKGAIYTNNIIKACLTMAYLTAAAVCAAGIFASVTLACPANMVLGIAATFATAIATGLFLKKAINTLSSMQSTKSVSTESRREHNFFRTLDRVRRVNVEPQNDEGEVEQNGLRQQQ